MRTHLPVCCALLIAGLAASAAAAQEQEDPEILVVAPGAPISFTEPPGTAVEAALGGGLLRPLEGPLEAPASGDHWLAVAARDDVGNLSPVRWLLVRVDGEGPEVAVTLDPEPVEGTSGGLWVPPGSRAQLSAEDAPAGVARVVLAAGQETAESQKEVVELGLPASGEVAVTGWAEDRVGNRSPVAKLAVTADAEAPSCEIRIRGPHVIEGETLVLGPPAALETVAEDAGSGLDRLERQLDGAGVGEEGWHPPWQPGPHRAGLTAADRVGNEGRCELAFTVDAEPPRLTWEVTAERSAGVGEERVFLPPVTLRVTAADAPAGVASLLWSEDGGSFTPLTGAVTTFREALLLAAEDRVGNRGEERVSWRLDTEPPGVRLLLPDGSEVAAGGLGSIFLGEEVRLEATDEGSGLASGRQSIDEGAWLELADLIDFERRGLHHLRVEVEDRLGNGAFYEWDVEVGRRRP